jgi:beta-lactam-binding protein with PASTA domain
MPQREFEITITPTGEVKLHVHGYKGRSCMEAVKLIEQMVGQVKSQQQTSEFYEPEVEARFRIDQRQ